MAEESKGFTVGRAIAAIAVFAIFYKACSPSDSPGPGNQELEKARAAAQEASAAQARTLGCRDQRPTMIEEYRRLMTASKFSEAARSLGDCHVLIADAELRALKQDAEQRGYLATGLNTKLTPDARLTALESLRKDYPEAAKPHEALIASLESKVAQLRDAERKRQEAAELAQRRREGVQLGMTQERVTQSSWGKPRKINRTTNIHGTHEQWVYDGGYLYFQDGILTSIQN